MWPPETVCKEPRAPAPAPEGSWLPLPSPSWCKRERLLAILGRTQSTLWWGSIRNGSACTGPQRRSFLLWKRIGSRGDASFNDHSSVCQWKQSTGVLVASHQDAGSAEKLGPRSSHPPEWNSGSCAGPCRRWIGRSGCPCLKCGTGGRTTPSDDPRWRESFLLSPGGPRWSQCPTCQPSTFSCRGESHGQAT